MADSSMIRDGTGAPPRTADVLIEDWGLPRSADSIGPACAGILPEAWGLVEDDHMAREDFHRFTFEHPAEFLGVDPEFFAGTAAEDYANETAR